MPWEVHTSADGSGKDILGQGKLSISREAVPTICGILCGSWSVET